MMKVATRSLSILDEHFEEQVGRSFIEAYQYASRHIPLAYVSQVERRQNLNDVSFVLTFEMARIETAADMEKQAVTYMILRHDDVAVDL